MGNLYFRTSVEMQEASRQQASLHHEAGAQRSYGAAVPESWEDTAAVTAASRGRLRVERVAALIAAASAVAVVGALAHDLGAGGIAGRRSSVAMLLGQAEFGGSVSHALQLERDKANVELLKARLARAEGLEGHAMPSGAAGGAKKGRARAAAAAGNRASKALTGGGQRRDVWLSASKGHAAKQSSDAVARAYTPNRMKKVKVKTVLKDIQLSLAAQQQATHAALMLLESQDGEEEKNKDSGDRGRTGLDTPAAMKGDNETASAAMTEENETACANFTLTNETECLPAACNATEINELWNASLPVCVEAEEGKMTQANEADQGNTTHVNASSPVATPAPWNKPENTSEAAADSGAAGVVAGDEWAGHEPKPQYDTIYCYDDNADGGFTRVARSATYCWYHRAYCELYCEGDIMSTPPPINMDSPAEAAYGENRGHLSWTSWAKRLRDLSPFVTLGATLVGEPKFNYGGIKIGPVKVPETTGGRKGGIFEKPYQDGR